VTAPQWGDQGAPKATPPGSEPGRGDQGAPKATPPGSEPGRGDQGAPKATPPGSEPGRGDQGAPKATPPGSDHGWRTPSAALLAGIVALCTFAYTSGMTPPVLAVAALACGALFVRRRFSLPQSFLLPAALVLGLLIFANMPEIPRHASIILPSAYAVGLYVAGLILVFLYRQNTPGEGLFVLFLSLLLTMLAGTTTEPFPYAAFVALEAVLIGRSMRAYIPQPAEIPARNWRRELAYLGALAAMGVVMVGFAVGLRWADTTFNMVVSMVDPPFFSSRAFAPRSTLSSILNVQNSERLIARVHAQYGGMYFVGRSYVHYADATWETARGKLQVRPLNDPKAGRFFSEPGNVFAPGNRWTISWRPRDVVQVDLASDLVGSVFVPREAPLVAVKPQFLIEDDADVLHVPPGTSFGSSYAFALGTDAKAMNFRKGEHRAMPATVRAYAQPLARQVTAGEQDDLARAAAIESWFHSNFQYVLGYPFQTEDPLREFLLEKRPAHCEFFATGMAMMLRSLDIPARYVTGFLVYERNERGGYLVVREEHAHAWVEVWDKNQGWVRFDPTPPAARLREKPHQALREWLDLIAYRLRKWQENFRELSVKHVLQGALNAVLGLGRWLVEAPWRVGILLLAFVLEALFRRPDAAGRRWLRERGLQRSARASTPRGQLVELMARVDAALARHGTPRPPHLTLLEWSAAPDERLDAEQRSAVRAFVRAYVLARYAGQEADVAAMEPLVREIERAPVKAAHPDRVLPALPPGEEGSQVALH